MTDHEHHIGRRFLRRRIDGERKLAHQDVALSQQEVQFKYTYIYRYILGVFSSFVMASCLSLVHRVACFLAFFSIMLTVLTDANDWLQWKDSSQKWHMWGDVIDPIYTHSLTHFACGDQWHVWSLYELLHMMFIVQQIALYKTLILSWDDYNLGRKMRILYWR